MNKEQFLKELEELLKKHDAMLVGSNFNEPPQKYYELPGRPGIFIPEIRKNITAEFSIVIYKFD